MRRADDGRLVVGVSGGPDSVYLLHSLLALGDRLVIGHLDHGARGDDSAKDRAFVERMGRRLGVEVRTGRAVGLSTGTAATPGFEERARKARRAFLQRVREDTGASAVLLAHTADDQVETVLMRILEGAGISGLKGIPRRSAEGVERPLLDTWRDEILSCLGRRKIPFRTDKSNRDTRFERNWIRGILIPLLEKRYGPSVKKRLLTLGERFREIDEFLDGVVRRWLGRNVKAAPGGAPAFRLSREAFSRLPAVVRKRVVQVLCFERLGIAPNERLIASADRVLVSGGPSARLSLGKGASLACRYGEAVFRPAGATPASGDAAPAPGGTLLVREAAGKPGPARMRRIAAGERGAVFDADGVGRPLSLRPLRAGDRIRPFGAPGAKKVKEILIDRKIPRDERWGRPVVCDGSGAIVWIPGLVRSAAAPVTPETRRTLVLALRQPAPARS